MAGNSLGEQFVVTTFGESHGKCVGVVIDGCPAGLKLSDSDVQTNLDRRIPRGAKVTSSRIEKDKVEILSGIFRGKTTGAPIAMLVWNRDIDSTPYEKIRDLPRPGHADYPAKMRYGAFNDYRGGGRFSGRMTVPLVMAGAVARALLSLGGVEVLAQTLSIGKLHSRSNLSRDDVRLKVYRNSTRCGDIKIAGLMEKAILRAAKKGDSLGGIVKVEAYNLPLGIGDPLFGSMDSELSRALFSIPAVKGVEFGAGFRASRIKGSQNNDSLAVKDGCVTFLANNAGGILGGLSTGREIVAHVAFKPTPSIPRRQRTVNLRTMKDAGLEVEGRHDPCIVPKAVPVVEAMVSIVLVDFMIRMQKLPKVLK